MRNNNQWNNHFCVCVHFKRSKFNEFCAKFFFVYWFLNSLLNAKKLFKEFYCIWNKKNKRNRKKKPTKVRVERITHQDIVQISFKTCPNHQQHCVYQTPSILREIFFLSRKSKFDLLKWNKVLTNTDLSKYSKRFE